MRRSTIYGIGLWAKGIRCLAIGLLTFLLASCTTDEGDVEAYDAPLVIEGWIESGKPPVVFVTQGIEASDKERTAEELRKYVIRRAHVTVEHNGKVYDLPNMSEDKYYLQYFYSTGRFVGKVGETYRLRVEYRGKVVTATTTIPEPAKLDSLVAEQTEYNDDLYYIWAYYHASPQKVRYYRFFTWVTNRERYYAPSYFGVLSDGYSEGPISFAIDRGPHLPDVEAEYMFRKGDRVKVKFATTTEEIYSFWRNYEQNNFCLTLGMAAYYGNMKSNIQGGLGYWAGYGLSEYELVIK